MAPDETVRLAAETKSHASTFPSRIFAADIHRNIYLSPKSSFIYHLSMTNLVESRQRLLFAHLFAHTLLDHHAQ